MKGEVWKDIPGFEGLYQASNLGRIKSLRRRVFVRGKGMRVLSERVLQSHIRKCGYRYLRLSKKGVVKSESVPRLVLMAFTGTPNRKEANHKNGIKTDDRLRNLEWVSPKENIRHAQRTGLFDNKGENHVLARLTNEEVSKIKRLLKKGHSQNRLAKRFGVSQATISRIHRRIRWRSVA